ncbi:MAG: hypothetical protein V4436_03475, partial [Patescibacteria group bacterium]
PTQKTVAVMLRWIGYVDPGTTGVDVGVGVGWVDVEVEDDVEVASGMSPRLGSTDTAVVSSNTPAA